jgi:yeast amino acid transporter
MVLIIIINIFGTLGYAEEEFWSSCLKLGAVIVFMIIALVLVLGGGPEGSRYDEYSGAKLWYDPGAFANGFRGFCSVFVTAAFSFSGTELVGLAAAEAANPLRSLPGAIKQVFWRITLFYILGLFFVGLLIPHNDEHLLGANPYADGASPFVLVGKYANLTGFDSFMNVIILVSVMSIGVSAVYGGSRTLTALAQQGYAPKLFSYIDRSGRPLVSVLFIIAFSPLAYVNLAAEGSTVFDWLLALSGLAAFFTWGSICLAHIRFRKAWLRQGHTLDEIPFQAVGGVYGSYLGLGLNILCLIAQVNIFAPPPNRCLHLTILTLTLSSSSTSPSALSGAASTTPKASSCRTLPCLSSSSSGSAALSGSAAAGCAPTRSMSIPAAVSSTGTLSMPTVPGSPLCRHSRGRSTGCLSSETGLGRVFLGLSGSFSVRALG